MTKEHMTEQLEYHYWATSKLIKACDSLSETELHKDVGGSFGSLFATLVHMYSAENIWLSRWKGIQGVGFSSLEDFPTLNDLDNAWQDKKSELLSFVMSNDVYEMHAIQYAEKTYQHALWQMILHMIDHSSFHRGQVINMIRDAGQTPPQTNFIHYLRTNNS